VKHLERFGEHSKIKDSQLRLEQLSYFLFALCSSHTHHNSMIQAKSGIDTFELKANVVVLLLKGDERF